MSLDFLIGMTCFSSDLMDGTDWCGVTGRSRSREAWQSYSWERRLSQPHTSVTEWWLTSSSLIFEEVKFGGLEFCLKLQFSTERFCNIQRITMLIRENNLLLNLISSTFYFIIWSLWGGWCVWESMNYGCWWKEIEWFSGNSRIPCVVCVIQGAVE